jgi:hypothetical protein
MAFTEKRLAGPTALTANTETNLYVCPTAQTTTTLIKQVLVTNTGSATTFDLSLVPQGGTAGTTNRLFSALSISANETVLLDVSQVMSSGDFISAKSGAGSTVNVTISGVENSGLMVISGLADSAVTTAKIADLNVATSKIDNLAVTTGKIANNAVTQGKLASSLSGMTVTTSSLLSTAIPSPFEGQMAFLTDTDRMLVWNGTAWVIPNAPAQNPQGLELVTTTTCSSGGTASNGVVTIGTSVSAVTVATAFSATYDNYRIVISGMIGPNNTQYGVRFAVDNSHRYAGWWMGFVGTSMTPAYSNAAPFIPVSWTSSSTNYNNYHSFDLFAPFLSVVPRVISPWVGSNHAGYYGGLWADTTSQTGFSIVPDSGTLSGGTITVYGYRKS